MDSFGAYQRSNSTAAEICVKYFQKMFHLNVWELLVQRTAWISVDELAFSGACGTKSSLVRRLDERVTRSPLLVIKISRTLIRSVCTAVWQPLIFNKNITHFGFLAQRRQTVKMFSVPFHQILSHTKYTYRTRLINYVLLWYHRTSLRFSMFFAIYWLTLLLSVSFILFDFPLWICM